MATILVVDDKAVNRDVLSVLLSHQGHRIVEACDGAKVLNSRPGSAIGGPPWQKY